MADIQRVEAMDDTALAKHIRFLFGELNAAISVAAHRKIAVDIADYTHHRMGEPEYRAFTVNRISKEIKE